MKMLAFKTKYNNKLLSICKTLKRIYSLHTKYLNYF